MSRIAIGFVFAASIAVAASAAHAAPPGDCAALKNLSLPDTRIVSAERVEPGWALPPSPFNMLGGPDPKIATSACRVVATIEKEIGIEVWLPDDWNGRFEGTGNGGFSGAYNYPAMSLAIGRGYAVAGTDTGHVTPTDMFDVSWIDGHPQRVADFAHRAHHLLAERGKAITAAYYARPAHHAYYSGCSSGGWQGLSEAQRYPGDYNGIVAGAPAINFVKLQVQPLLAQQWSERDPSSVLTVAQLKALSDASIKYCDARDGVTDGVIENPAACHFDPGTLACKPGETGTCLNAAQVARARASYGPQHSKGGMRLYPGDAWGTAPLEGFAFPPGNSALVRVLTHKPEWTVATFDPDHDIPPMEADVGPLLDTWNTDLRPFRAAGGKLILYHGWSDPLLSPFNTIDYYEDMRARTGDAEFARLFMVPGMAHCAGGEGPWMFDALTAMVDWVEHGRAPVRIAASHPAMTPTHSDRTRPLCPYPNVARYNGSGSTDDETNFSCAAP